MLADAAQRGRGGRRRDDASERRRGEGERGGSRGSESTLSGAPATESTVADARVLHPQARATRGP
eukprot:2126213-Pleurochrysis_carterae.AAC.1